MKKIIIFLCLIVLSSIDVFGQYTIKIRLGSIYIEPGQGHEWKVNTYADIFDNNGNLITPPTGTTYSWEKDNCDGNGFTYWGSGNSALTDGQILEGYTPTCDNSLDFQTSHIKVTVTINGSQYFSDIVRVPDNSSGTLDQKEVSLNQKNENNTSVGLVGKSSGSSFLNYTVPFTFYYPATVQSDVFRASQSVISNEKYNNWAGYTDVINHRTFTLTNQTQTLTSQFGSIADATVKASVPEFPSASVKAEFKDPWLIDDYSDPLGPRNRGMDNANYISLDNVQNNLGISTNHQGVFLGLDPSNGAQAYYSVRAPLAPIVNGANAFFSGWTTSGGVSLQQVDPNPSGYDQKAVVFTSGGASVTANYAYTTVSMNTTIQSGTYNTVGTLTVLPGVTLTVNSGAVLKFPSSGRLVVKGKLVTNGGTFTSQSGSWKGITLSHAEGSSLQNTTISYALTPIIIDTTSSVSITNCTINHSSFYDNNFNEAAAIQVWNSTPVINSITIEGQSNSWNGVRFTNGSGGTLENSTIENLGYGNGVIIQGGSNPSVADNVIQNNYYHGIVIYYNGSADPLITDNTVSYNGEASYIGIYFANSIGTVRQNNVNHSHYGIWARYASSPDAGQVGEEGSNTIINNDVGLAATDNSYPSFGLGTPPKGYYWGVCNHISGNSLYDALAARGAVLYAEYNWWGQYPLNQSKFYTDSTSRIDNDNPETNSNDCPLGEQPAAYKDDNMMNGSLDQASVSVSKEFSEVIKGAMKAKFMRNYTKAASLCRSLLDNKSAVFYHKEALITLFNIFQLSGDSSLINSLEEYTQLKNNLSVTAKQMLASAYISSGKLSSAESILNGIKMSNPNSEAERNALLSLTSLSAFNKTYKSKSENALNELIQKHSSSIDAGIITALGTSINNSLSKNSNKLSAQVSETDGSDSLSYQLNNYPNPFNPSTTISYQIPKEGFVTLKIYDMLGKEVTTLVNEFETKGKYNVNFDTESVKGGLSSGVYLYQLTIYNGQLTSKSFSSTKKLLLLR